MILKTFIEPPIENNNYVIIDEETRKGALIDCSHFDEQILDFLKEKNAELEYILLTHGHFDHIAGIVEFLSSGKLSKKPQIYLHKDDLKQIEKSNQYMSLFGLPDIQIPVIDKYVEEGEIIKLGNLNIKVLHTPGHTQGGVCYSVDDILFSGDTIFKESVGRCDLDGGDFLQIVESIKNKIFTLPENTVIYSGHGSSTTVGWEKVHNQFA